MPLHKVNRYPSCSADKPAQRAYHKRIETLYSQLTTMGVQWLHARTNPGLELKAHASLLAAVVTNGDEQSGY